MHIVGWAMEAAGTQLVPREQRLETLEDDQVAVEVAGCGVCRGDLEILSGAARVGHPMPLTLGHEIVGTVVDAGGGAADWLARDVVVPAAIPCDGCDHCRWDDERSCVHPLLVGRDTNGGFASHVVLPARGLCAIDSAELAHSGLALADLAVLAETVLSPYEAIARSGLHQGDVAVIVGAGDMGGFAVQIAALLDAYVVALDTNDAALERAALLGATHTMNVRGREPAFVRRSLYAHAHDQRWRDCCWKIFETSGTAAGQLLAFALMTEGSVLALVGDRCNEVVPVRLSELAALDATAQGVRGGLAEHVPAALELILAGDLRVQPLVEQRPLGAINEILREVREGQLLRRPILVPNLQ